jgi:hypothetical protein
VSEYKTNVKQRFTANLNPYDLERYDHAESFIDRENATITGVNVYDSTTSGIDSDSADAIKQSLYRLLRFALDVRGYCALEMIKRHNLKVGYNALLKEFTENEVISQGRLRIIQDREDEIARLQRLNTFTPYLLSDRLIQNPYYDIP